MEVDDANVVELRRPIDEGLEEDLRGCRGAVEIDLVAAADPGDGLGWADDLHVDQCG
jgi:hypothetical protein